MEPIIEYKRMLMIVVWIIGGGCLAAAAFYSFLIATSQPDPEEKARLAQRYADPIRMAPPSSAASVAQPSLPLEESKKIA